MLRMNKTLKQQLTKDITNHLKTLGILSVFLFFIYSLPNLTDENIMTTDSWFCIYTIILLPPSQSFVNYPEYITFGFCRKKFYHEQVLICIVRAVITSFFRTVLQACFYNGYIQIFMEETNKTVNDYHTVPLFELFFTNVCIFTLFSLMQLINSTSVLSLYFLRTRTSPRLNERITMHKKKRRLFRIIAAVFIKLPFFLLLCVMTVIIPYFYQLQMQNALPVRLSIVTGILFLCAVLYLVGKKRFTPTYI